MVKLGMKKIYFLFIIIFLFVVKVFAQTIPQDINKKIIWMKQLLLEFPNSNFTGLTRLDVYDYEIQEDIIEGEKIRGFQGFHLGLKNNVNAALAEVILLYNYESYERILRERKINLLKGEYFTALENAGFVFIEKREAVVEYILFDEINIPLITINISDRITNSSLIGIDIYWERWSKEERDQFGKQIYPGFR